MELDLDITRLTIFDEKIQASPKLEEYFSTHFLNLPLLPRDRAKAIYEYMVEKFAYSTSRFPQLDEFIQAGHGNCSAHSRLGIYLLKLANVPTRPILELHFDTPSESRRAIAVQSGKHFCGYCHNDHLFCSFFDGRSWQIFDSAMRVFGTRDFIQSRFPYKRIKSFHEGVEREGVVGAPFCLWSLDDRGRVVNITKVIGKSLSEMSFLSEGMGSYNDFHKA
jgi:hypothetical protein